MNTRNDLEKSLNLVISEPLKYDFVPDYDPDGEFEGIRALTIDSVPYCGKKTKIFGYYGLPQKAGKEKAPAVLLIHGGGGHAYSCWVKMWNNLGFAAIAIDTTGFMPCKKNAGSREGGGDEEFWKRELGDFYEEGYTVSPDSDVMLKDELPFEEQWMFHALSAAVKAHNFLREQPEIDVEKIGVNGISWGGVITSLLIGYDMRFKFAVPVYGSGYVGDGMGELSQNFRREKVRELWLAEDNFDRVKIPVLWIGWNDDSPFSVHSQTLSYNKTVRNNEKTRLVYRNNMMHSHRYGWMPYEIYKFALSVIGESSQLPKVLSQPKGRKFSFKIEASKDISFVCARAYYITAPMQYSKFNKYNCGERYYMSETWKTCNCTIENGMVSGELPKECREYYVEIVFNGERDNLVVSTEFVKLTD